MSTPNPSPDLQWDLGADVVREPTETIAIVEAPQGYVDAPGLAQRMLAPPRISKTLGGLHFGGHETVAETPTPAAATSPGLPTLHEYPPLPVQAAELGGAASAGTVDFSAGRFPVLRPIANLLTEPAPVEIAAQELVVAAEAQAAATIQQQQSVQLEEAQIRAIIAQLSLRDTAKEALRARMIEFGSRTRQRSAYELVFIMLGFAVMLLVTIPALVPLVNAVRGHGS